jgi:hypothetical protein
VRESVFSGTPPLSQPVQLPPLLQLLLTAPVQVQVSAAALATGKDGTIGASINNITAKILNILFIVNPF